MRRTLLKTILPFVICAAFVGCTAAGGFAYDDTASNQRQQCEHTASMSDRQDCVRRIDSATRQAGESRRSN